MNTTSLYEITGDIKDINSVLVNRAELSKLQKDSDRLNWLLTYFVGPRTELDDKLVDASDSGVEALLTLIDGELG